MIESQRLSERTIVLRSGTVKLRKGTPILHLGGGLIQVGTTAEHSVVFSNVSADDCAWLEDNVAQHRNSQHRNGQRHHVCAPDANVRLRRRAMLKELREAGLTVSSPATTPRKARIRIVGLDAVGCILSRIFASMGVGSLDLRDVRPITPEVEPLFPHDSKGLLRKSVLDAELARPGLSLGRQMVPHLVVTTHKRVVADDVAGLLLSQELPHLPIISDDREIIVGPLVVPGVTCCTFCLDWHRGDYIPQWAKLKAKLRNVEPADCLPHLAHVAAGVAAGLFFALINPQSTLDASGWYSGQTWRVTPEGLSQERWDPDPRCGCTLKIPPGLAD